MGLRCYGLVLSGWWRLALFVCLIATVAAPWKHVHMCSVRCALLLHTEDVAKHNCTYSLMPSVVPQESGFESHKEMEEMSTPYCSCISHEHLNTTHFLRFQNTMS